MPMAYRKTTIIIKGSAILCQTVLKPFKIISHINQYLLATNCSFFCIIIKGGLIKNIKLHQLLKKVRYFTCVKLPQQARPFFYNSLAGITDVCLC